METKVLIIGIVKNGNSILMRKKPDGSPPYKETWYIFGGVLTPGNDPHQIIIDTVRQQSGANISVSEEFSWDTEVKHDHDGIEKQFVYLDVLCEYIDGDLITGAGIEELGWVPIDKLHEYDIVPPSIKVFQKLGYIK